VALGAYRIHVSVVRSGHPVHVFGTDRLSDHPRGRAFDTWAIDGRPVVARSTPRSLVEEYLHAAADAGSYNVGGPYLLGPPRSGSATTRTTTTCTPGASPEPPTRSPCGSRTAC